MVWVEQKKFQFWPGIAFRPSCPELSHVSHINSPADDDNTADIINHNNNNNNVLIL